MARCSGGCTVSEQTPTRIYEKDRPVFERLRKLPMHDLLQQPITLLPLAARASGYCEKHNIATIGQLVACKKADLLKAKNMGRKTVAHVVAYLNELGLGLDGRLSATVPPALPPPFVRGAKAMRLAVLAELAAMNAPHELVQHLGAIPLPDPEDEA